MPEILHRPNFEIPKHYETDGRISHYSETNISPEKFQPTKELIKEIDALKPIVRFVPDAVAKAINTSLDLVRFFLILVEDTPVIEDETIITEEDNEDDDYNKYFPDNPPHIVIDKGHHRPEQIIESKYYQTIVDISQKYLVQIKDVYMNYNLLLLNKPELLEVLPLVFEGDLSHQPLEIQNIGHALLKSQQAKEANLRLSSKLYNEIQALNVLKSLEYSKLSLIRLSKQTPQDAILAYKHKQVVAQEERRMERKYYETYRYLDSSIKLIEDCLNQHATEAYAKLALKNANVKFESNKIPGVVVEQVARIPEDQPFVVHNPSIPSYSQNAAIAVDGAPSEATPSSGYPYVAKNKRFGDFAYRNIGGGKIEIDPTWISSNIISIEVPQILRRKFPSSIKVHKLAYNNFQKAFELLAKSPDLLKLVNTYDEVWTARHITWQDSKGISNHSWAVAIDINASKFPMGTKVNTSANSDNPNYILFKRVFEPAGFSWGNSYADPMHYELL